MLHEDWHQQISLLLTANGNDTNLAEHQGSFSKLRAVNVMLNREKRPKHVKDTEFHGCQKERCHEKRKLTQNISWSYRG